MKKYLRNNPVRQSVLSLLTLGVFILVGIGSWEAFPVEIEREYKGNGIYEEDVYFLSGRWESYTGGQDSEGRYQGPHSIQTQNKGEDYYTEEVVFVNGRRHGKSDTFNEQGKLIYSKYYNMGVEVEGMLKSAEETKAATSAFEVLRDRYPWLSHKLNVFGFEDVYLEAYLDTVELLLDQTARDEEYFNDYFDMVTSNLEETHYDSLIVLNESISAYLGIQEMKNSELRLAVIKRYSSNGNTTFNIVNATFPNYLLTMKQKGVDDADFEAFCHVLDSCMDSKGVLDLEDPFLIDSINSRFSESLINIYESDEYDLKGGHISITDFRELYREIRSTHTSTTLITTPPEVAGAALSLMYQRFEQGDILKKSAKEAYILNKGKIRLPVVTTVFSRNISPSSVNLKGYILEDGGSEVTASGMVWASHYNPTTEDQAVPSAIASGSFTVTVEGLTEGSTYYARSFASNSAGTAYGNCISFVATAPTGLSKLESSNLTFSIYPNPVSAQASFSFIFEGSEPVSLTLIDMSGRIVCEHNPGTLFQGKNQIQLDLSELPDGIYTCLLSINGVAATSQNLIISH